jgi:hypothetical protein
MMMFLRRRRLASSSSLRTPVSIPSRRQPAVSKFMVVIFPTAKAALPLHRCIS